MCFLSDRTDLDLDAQKFKSFAFASHVEAYWNDKGTTPLAVLNTVDLFAIVLTPDLNDLTNSDGMTQAAEIMIKLSGYWAENPDVFGRRAIEFLLNRSQIREMIIENAGKAMANTLKIFIDKFEITV